jgi:hypothetical protein
LNVATSRQQILNYFKSPPVKDAAQKKIIKILIASEFKGALLLFRPAKDQAQIKKDFSAIFDFKYSSDERRNANKQYKQY